MSTSANVKSIQALADLKTMLARYGGDVQETLQRMTRTIEQTRHTLTERQNHWRMQVRRCEEQLAQARAALTHCQNSAYTDREGRRHVPDCRRFEQTVSDARRQLDAANQALRNVEQAIKQVEAAVHGYEQHARRLSNFVNNDLKSGQALLERKITTLQAYVAGGLIGGAVGLVANVLSNIDAASPLPGPTSIGVWQELGIVDVPLTQIDLGDSHVHGPDDFKKVPVETMLSGLQKLESTVRPAVEKGAAGDYFCALDTQHGLDYQDGYRRVYDAFYGDEPIRLEKMNGRYQVVNGYHRLFAVQQLGLTTIPASVIAQQETDDNRGATG